MAIADRWSHKIVAFLHDPPGKALVLRSRPHTLHENLASALQQTALGRPASSEEGDRATKADHIASAADRVNFPGGATAYWDQVPAFLKHPLARDASLYELNLPATPEQLDGEIQEEAAHTILEPWAKDLRDLKSLYLHLWRLFYEELARKTSLGGKVRVLPADTRQPDHPLEQHLSITAAIADALPQPVFLVFSIGPVQEFIAAARRTQDVWMGSWLLSYLSWTAMKCMAEAYGPDVIVYPSLRGQPLCDHWLSTEHGVPCQPSPQDLVRPTFPNKFVALLPAKEAKQAAQKAEKAVRQEWEALANEVYKKLKDGFLPADEITDKLWKDQIAQDLEVYWVVLPWMGSETPSGKGQAEAVIEAYRDLLRPSENWRFEAIYRVLYEKGQYDPNWGTVWSLLYDLADRAFGSRKNLRDFQPAEETGAKCTICGQRAALRSRSLDAQAFWEETAERLRNRNQYEIKPEGKERLCAICTVKRFVQREVLEESFGIKIGFPSTSEIATAAFKKRLLESLRDDKVPIREALKGFLQNAEPLIGSVASGALPHLESIARGLTGEEGFLAQQLLQLDGEYLLSDTWTCERLRERWPKVTEKDVQDGREALRQLYEAMGEAPARYYALLYMDGDHMGRWLSGTHKKLATFGDILHPEVRKRLENDPDWKELLLLKRIITPAVHAAISQALGQFSLRLVPHIIEERYPGRLIYTGGDDVLALVPLAYAMPVARELRWAFSGHIRFNDGDLEVIPREDAVSGYVEWGEELFLTMGPEATASVGMVFAHHLHPLDLVLQAVRRAEKAAKNRYGRNALALEVLKRSGETFTVGTCWCDENIGDVVAFLQDIAWRLQEEKISAKWPYGVQAELPALEVLPQEAQRAELRRLLRRQAGEHSSREEKDRQAEELSAKLVSWAAKLSASLGAQSGFAEMVHWLLVCSFITRGGEV